jgi:hypothetical protein
MATDVEKMRILIPDSETVFDGTTLFTDDELTNYVEVANGSVLRGAGYAMLAISNSEAMISKVIKTQDLMTNGAQVAEAMRKNAQVLFDRADKEDEMAGEFYIDIVDGFGGPWRNPELTEWALPGYDDPYFGNGGYGN